MPPTHLPLRVEGGPLSQAAAIAVLALSLLDACTGGNRTAPRAEGSGSAAAFPGPGMAQVPVPPGGAPGAATASAGAGPGAPAPPPPPAGTERPIGSPRFCPDDDGTGVALVPGRFPSTIPENEARSELEGTNAICGDTRCEGTFEWFVYDLRSAGGNTDQTMRVYARSASPKGTTAAGLVVRGPGYTGRVVGEHVVPACTTPCRGFKVKPRWSPCLMLDIRCELDVPWQRNDGRGLTPWEKASIDCGIAIEREVRAIHPEYAEEE